ncbi:hypothetical protein SEA_KISI_82 [Mycobacterium phage KiSi]|uniref:Uncharacterized protein n=1 Tax=Mycobacterium phage KiSi TaxID=2507856 RepID=A0A410TBR7_9CAUD|nr:hypothetical protein I5G98_gp026 [Mycobacterium phage KiSi]QAU06500.1 hypothetical protein SEA_KISI_82 [Mycobacterium phage KiSi]
MSAAQRAQRSVAEVFPARTDAQGRTWYRPVRDAGTDLSQWGWTSQRKLAHPDYLAAADESTGGLHPEGLCGGDCSGCVSEGEGGGRDGSEALDDVARGYRALAEASEVLTGGLW